MEYRDPSACATIDLPANGSDASGDSRSRRGQRDFARERRLSAWILLAAAGCFAALAAPFLFGRVYVADDLGQFHLPVRNFYAQQLARGEPFDWMPSLYGGFYIAGEGQLGAYHPWHLALYRFLPLWAAFDVELLASYGFMFGGTYLLFRRLIGRRDAALFGGLVFTFGGFNLLHFVHPNAIAVVAHLPWLLLSIDVALTTDSAWQRAAAELGVGLLTASQLLLGYPQYVWFSLLAEIAFVGWRAAGRSVRFSRLPTLALAMTLGVAAGAVQWMPMLHLLGESTRQTADAAFAKTGSLDPLNLVQLLAPYLFQTRVVGQNTHELGLYIGAVPTVLCIWLLAHRREWGRFRPLVRALLVFGGLALLLAAGEFGPLYQLQSWIPLANRFRFPCRAIVLIQLCMAAGAAVAAAILFGRETGSHRTPASRTLWAAFGASVVLAIAGPLVWPDFVARGLLVWTGPLMVGAAALVIALVERGVRGAAIALVAFTALDLSCYGLSYSVVGRTADLGQFVAGIELPPNDANVGEANCRVVAPDRSGGPRVGDRMLFGGMMRVDGYAGLEPAKRLDYRQKRMWQLAGAGWAWQATDDRDEANRAWVRVSPTAPRARLVTQTTKKSCVLFFPARVEPAVELGASEPGAAGVVVDRPGRITIETDCPARQLLVTTESFDSGWKVLVDGQSRGIVRVDGDFLGCPVEAGKHRVQFDFRPTCRQLGVLVSVGGLGLMVLVSCMGVFFRRPRRGGEGVPCCEKL